MSVFAERGGVAPDGGGRRAQQTGLFPRNRAHIMRFIDLIIVSWVRRQTDTGTEKAASAKRQPVAGHQQKIFLFFFCLRTVE